MGRDLFGVTWDNTVPPGLQDNVCKTAMPNSPPPTKRINLAGWIACGGFPRVFEQISDRLWLLKYTMGLTWVRIWRPFDWEQKNSALR